MKIRQGFVSNSSTTSFCIYGTCFESKPLTLKVIKNFKKSNPEEFEKIIKANEGKGWCEDAVKLLKNIDNIDELECELEDDEVLEELLYECMPFGLEWHPYYDAGSYYIGRSWSSIGDDVTGKQFKEAIKTSLRQLFGEDIKCSTYAEAWRNG